MLVELLAPTDRLSCVFVAYDLRQTTYWPLLVGHQSTEQDSSAELSVPDSKSQPICDLVEPLQLDDFAVLYVERATDRLPI